MEIYERDGKFYENLDHARIISEPNNYVHIRAVQKCKGDLVSHNEENEFFLSDESGSVKIPFEVFVEPFKNEDTYLDVSFGTEHELTYNYYVKINGHNMDNYNLSDFLIKDIKHEVENYIDRKNHENGF